MEQVINGIQKITDNPSLIAVILFIFYLILAKAADIFTAKGLKRLTKATKSTLDDHIINLIHRPVFFTVVLVGAIHSINVLNASDEIVLYSRAFFLSLITIIWGICIIKISSLVVDNSIQKVSDITGLSKEVAPLLENIWKVIVIICAIMFILSLWEVNISPLLASAGIAGAALALASKDTLANFFGGISIFIDKPYKISDYIVLDSGERGEVVSIGIRSTRIKTRDDILITIPNAVISNAKIMNESAPVPRFRIRVPISVSYGSKIEKVEDILYKIALDNKNVLSNPEPKVRFRTFEDSFLNFELLCWVKEPSLRGGTIHEINKEIYREFNENNVTIPFPHRTVYLREEKNWQKG